MEYRIIQDPIEAIDWDPNSDTLLAMIYNPKNPLHLTPYDFLFGALCDSSIALFDSVAPFLYLWREGCLAPNLSMINLMNGNSNNGTKYIVTEKGTLREFWNNMLQEEYNPRQVLEGKIWEVGGMIDFNLDSKRPRELEYSFN